MTDYIDILEAFDNAAEQSDKLGLNSEAEYLRAARHMAKELIEASGKAQTALASTRYLLDKYCGEHQWIPHIESAIERIKKARAGVGVEP